MDTVLVENNKNTHLTDRLYFIRDLILNSVNREIIQKVYLFGSYAYGEPDEESDFDLCVIINDNNDKMKIYMDISLNLINHHILNFDLLVYRNEVFIKAIQKDGIENLIYNKGKILYA